MDSSNEKEGGASPTAKLEPGGSQVGVRTKDPELRMRYSQLFNMINDRSKDRLTSEQQKKMKEILEAVAKLELKIEPILPGYLPPRETPREMENFFLAHFKQNRQEERSSFNAKSKIIFMLVSSPPSSKICRCIKMESLYTPFKPELLRTPFNSPVDNGTGPSSRATSPSPRQITRPATIMTAPTTSTGPVTPSLLAPTGQQHEPGCPCHIPQTRRLNSGRRSTTSVSKDPVDAVRQWIQQLEMEAKGETGRDIKDFRKEMRTRVKGSVHSSIDASHPLLQRLQDPRTDDPLVGALMQACVKRGFTISTSYAECFLLLNGKKLVPALTHLTLDLDTREAALEATGRVSFKNEIITAKSAGLTTRDLIIKHMEKDDEFLMEHEEKGWKSFYGKRILGYKPEEADYWYQVYMDEAHWRTHRSLFYRYHKAKVASGGITQEEFQRVIAAFDAEGERQETEAALKLRSDNEPSFDMAKALNILGKDFDHLKAPALKSMPADSTQQVAEGKEKDEALEVAGEEYVNEDEQEDMKELVESKSKKSKKKRRKDKGKGKGKAKAEEMMGDGEKEELEKLSDFMENMPEKEELEKLRDIAENMAKREDQDALERKSEAGDYDELTYEERAAWIEERGHTQLVHQLRTCNSDELARHKFFIGKHRDITGSIFDDTEPIGGMDAAVKYFLEQCPYIKTRERAEMELSIADANSALAVGFARFRERHLDKTYGKRRRAYDEAEAARFAAAVAYKIDLDEEWVGPVGN